MLTGGYGFEDALTGGILMLVWTILIFILAIAGGICLYIFVILPKKEIKNKFLNWMKQFLNFDQMLLEVILKVMYIISALFITVWPIALIFTSAVGIFAAMLTIVVGNVILRVSYEFMLILIMTWKNTSEINKKLKEK